MNANVFPFFCSLYPLLRLCFERRRESGEEDVTTVYSEQTSYRERTDARLSRMEKDMKDLQKAIGHAGRPPAKTVSRFVLPTEGK